MKLSDLSGAAPLLRCLQWLDTLTAAPVVEWNFYQREAARHDLDKARELLDADLLTLAHRGAVLRRIDEVEADTQANPPAPPAPEETAAQRLARGELSDDEAQAFIDALPRDMLARHEQLLQQDYERLAAPVVREYFYKVASCPAAGVDAFDGHDSACRLRVGQGCDCGAAHGVPEPLLGVPLSTLAQATGAVMVCSDHDAACAEVPAGLRCKGCPHGVGASDSQTEPRK